MSSSPSAEKFVKQALKTISKINQLEYEELKQMSKKIIRNARNYDESMLGVMEEMMDISQISSEEDLEEFNIATLRTYCQIKDINPDGSERSVRARVWESIQEEYGSDGSDEFEEESDESEPEPEPEPEPVVKKKKSKKSVSVVPSETVIS